MKTKLWAIVFPALLLFIFAYSVVRGDASGSASDLEKSVYDLQKKTQSMAGEIAALRKRIEELEAKSAVKTITIPGSQIQPGQPIPRGATPFEFNGAIYYIVPLRK